MQNLAEAGLNLENCELWFGRAVVAFVGVTAVLLVVRLQFTLTLSNFYSQLHRHRQDSRSHTHQNTSSPHRIYLLPPRHPYSPTSTSSGEQVLVYAPVPTSLSVEDARQLQATEAWVSRTEPPRDSDRTRSGRIGLPVAPDEGLFDSEWKQI